MNEEWKHRGTKIDHVKVDVELSILLESIHWECAEKNSNLCLPGLEQRVNCFREPLEIHWNLPLARGGGPRGARGARAPLKIEDLWSKSFENLQNLTFRSNRAPLE